MRVLAAVVLAMVSVSCTSTGGHYEMRAAAFVVPTFEEEGEREDENGDDSAWIPAQECVADHEQAGECVERTRSAKIPVAVQAKAAR